LSDALGLRDLNLNLYEPHKEIITYQRWFGRYARSYLSDASSQDKVAMGLKLVHSQRVRKLAKDLALCLNLAERQVFLSELCGLFHDIGRLPQFKKYKTFFDAKSEDHAALGVEVLERHGVFSDLGQEEKTHVLDAIFVHNKFSIPKAFQGQRLILSKILRDADKIDIWRVFDDYYRKGSVTKDVNLGLPPGRTISGAVLEDLESDKIVRIEHVQNQLDFIIMRLSWLFDINFKHSLGIIAKRNYIHTMFQMLPEGKEKEIVRRKITALLEERLGR